MRIVIIIFFSSTVFTAWPQSGLDVTKLSDEAKEILARIDNDESVPADTMGIRGGYLPKDYPLTLLRKISVDELVRLTDHTNAIVRCYAFKALTMTDEKASFGVVKSHVHDTVQISTYHGCFGGDEFVGDFFVGVFNGHEAVAHDSVHMSTLDSMLIFTPNKLNARSGAIRTAGKKGKYYDRIREIAINEKSGAAVIALAGFRKIQDVDIILKTKVTGGSFEFPLATTLFAISLFPHPEFLPFLEEHLQSLMGKKPNVECRFLYQAISNYNSDKATALLSRPFEIQNHGLRSEHLKELSKVLRKNQNPFYDGLRRKIKSELK